MALRYPDRYQATMLPPAIEDYVPEDAPVRFYDLFIEQIGIDEIGIDRDLHKVGCPAYDPKAMLKLLVYAYSYGIRSSRKIEREVHNNLSFIWLMGGLKPDYWTISDFRRRNKKALDELNGTDRTSVNLTDPDAARISSPRATGAAYNAQATVDDKHGLIVNADVVHENVDYGQLANQINQANETLAEVIEKKPPEKEVAKTSENTEENRDSKNNTKEEVPARVASADCGYHNIDAMKQLQGQGITVIVPSKRQVNKKTPGEFDVSRFTYDPGNDCFIWSGRPNDPVCSRRTVGQSEGVHQFKADLPRLPALRHLHDQ